MNRFRFRILTCFSFFIITCIILSTSLQAYNTQAVDDYAWQWKNQINSLYHDYRDHPIFHEDANFVSQALIAGGLLHNSQNLYAGAPVDDKGCIITREVLAYYLKDYEHAKAVGFKIDLFVPTSLANGDVVFFGDAQDPFKSVGIVQGYNPVWDDFAISYHANKTGGVIGNVKSLDELMLIFGGATFYHIPKPAEVSEDQRFYAGESYYGPGALSVEIFKPGGNYLGYILSNYKRLYQDMAIATDTSDPVLYKGCSYMISGYCCDPTKKIPPFGQTFGTPWTSDSPDNWAYWVRKAIVYGTEHHSHHNEILCAVWHIVGRTGDWWEGVNWRYILDAIGYPPDGPTKSELVYLPLLVNPGTSVKALGSIHGLPDRPGLRNITPPVQKDATELLKQKMDILKKKRKADNPVN